ncbi:hypothetical protein ACIQ6K_33635 [Streptomyces sp. NPDC096354]
MASLPSSALEARTGPGLVFAFTLDQTPDDYRTMADRQDLKALIRP